MEGLPSDALHEVPIAIAWFDGLGTTSEESERQAYLVALVKAILDGREIIDTYGVVLILLLAGFSVRHWLQKHHRSRPTKQPKAEQQDVPLLPRTTPLHPTSSCRQWRLHRAVSAWLTYQPAALPVIGRTLPSNATSLLVLAWFGLNVCYHFYRLPLRRDMFVCFGIRAGNLFIVNLPLLYLLAAKNQPLKWLTGYSYEALNVLHRRVGEYMCLMGAVHFLSIVVWRFFIEEEWLHRDDDGLGFFLHPLVMEGLGAFTGYELLYFTSLASFRQRWYEIFLATHVFLQVGALVSLYLHFHTSRPFVLASLAIFLVDRLVWRFWLKSATVTADIEVLEDGETVLVSANWDLAATSTWHGRSILNGWRPADHVFITIPRLGLTHALQAHPFTIASAAPSMTTREGTHAWFNLLIRAHDGFTRDLLRRAEAGPCRMPVHINGPYGSRHALDLLRAADAAVVVAGGSGIAVAFPLLWALLHEDESDQSAAGKPTDADEEIESRTRFKRVHFLWVTHSRSHKSWIPKHQLDEMVNRGLDLVMPEPTAEAGRPDVVGLVSRWINAVPTGGRVGVVVCGPDGLNRSVRNACSKAIGEGANVGVSVEKFGW